MDRQTLYDLIPAYALGALEEGEEAALDALFAKDAVARQRLADYRQLSAGIALAAPTIQPPADLEVKVLQRVRQEQEKPPRPTRFLKRRRLGMVAALAAALLLVVAVVFLLEDEADKPLPLSGQALYQQLINDPNSQSIALVPILSDDIRGELRYRPDSTEAVIRVENLPLLAEDEAYQLWIVDEDGATSGGVYNIEPGTQYIIVPLERPANTYERIGCTIAPTEERVFNIPIGSS